jgi:hypothetical protein
MDFRTIHFFSVKKADNRTNFAGDRIINRRSHHNSLCREEKKHEVTSYVMVYKAMSHVTLPRMRELSPLLYKLPKIKGSYFPNSSPNIYYESNYNMSVS